MKAEGGSKQRKGQRDREIEGSSGGADGQECRSIPALWICSILHILSPAEKCHNSRFLKLLSPVPAEYPPLLPPLLANQHQDQHGKGVPRELREELRAELRDELRRKRRRELRRKPVRVLVAMQGRKRLPTRRATVARTHSNTLVNSHSGKRRGER